MVEPTASSRYYGHSCHWCSRVLFKRASGDIIIIPSNNTTTIVMDIVQCILHDYIIDCCVRSTPSIIYSKLFVIRYGKNGVLLPFCFIGRDQFGLAATNRASTSAACSTSSGAFQYGFVSLVLLLLVLLLRECCCRRIAAARSRKRTELSVSPTAKYASARL